MALPYKLFQIKHPEYDSKLWAKARAFYAGGAMLLGDTRLLKEVFPPHLQEENFVYEERCKRAYYIPYAGEIIDSICASLFAEPLRLESEPQSDEWYEDWWDDCSAPAGRKQSVNQLLKDQLLTALLCRQSWTLVDLPDLPNDYGLPESLAEQEQAGLLDAYACTIDPENVYDWEETEDGELLWALICHKEMKRESLESGRNVIREEFTYYTPDAWKRWAIEYNIQNPPVDSTEVEEMDEGSHSFGRVPLLRLKLSDGLWAMGKILPIAIAHFNKRNALSWAEYKSLFPVLASFQAAEDPLNPITEDPERAVNQKYGQGRIAMFGDKDRLEFVGPDAAPFEAAMKDLGTLRDEMHRVLHSMALSVDNSAAALQRSAESKQVDKSATMVILRSLGQTVKEHLIEVLEMVARGRGDKEVEWTPEGLEKFDEVAVEALMEQATTVDTISIPSATFKQIWIFQIARRLLGENATDEELDQIRAELEANITNEQFLAPMTMNGGFGEDIGGLEDMDEEEEDEEEETKPRKASPGNSSKPKEKTGFSSKPQPSA